MDYSQHLHWTYRQLRMLAGASLIAIPVLIVIIGWSRHQIILPTLSHYYFGEAVPGLLRMPNHSLNRTHCGMRLKARHFILGL
jgi:hypothetical protein